MTLASRTISVQQKDIVKNWVLIDAEGQSLGKVAAKAASIIRGKTKPTFTPHMDTGDNVIVINASKIRLTGKKWNDKIYYRHTGFPGGIKSRTAQEMFDRKPASLIKEAVFGMLPKNRLGRTLKTNIRVYDGSDHPHTSQNPENVTL
ncbi:MAG: 50S ribosomal protein L13 [Candidatus Nitrohelix vancouverensis]|uniref:Large ribosomal subunit protein uL13 n=1 Tax=Candidatus Nitrohelix vancouverensis TaxID=2705534 RepID=A0A7T0BZR0_9BACT|nr:MAG: 50S ribosomal protein L13 [Candidatus Nitrohelix vancouverensis]